VIVLTSQEVGVAFNAVTMQALDAMLEAPKTDWLAGYAKAFAKSQDNADADWQKHLAARASNAPPSLPLASYAGTYRDPWYGDIAIANEGGKLVVRFTKTPDLVGDIEPWQHDTFVIRWRQRWLNADAFLDFALTIHQYREAAGLFGIRNSIFEANGRCVWPRRIFEGEDAVILYVIQERQSLSEISFRLSGEPYDDIRSKADLTARGLHPGNAFEILLARVETLHGIQHSRRPALHRQVDVIAQRGRGIDRIHDWFHKVPRV